ncbi:MAG: hypothetical protein ACR2OE_05570 [Thermomicrobiales bacterium]
MIDGNGHARVLRIRRVGVAPIPDGFPLGFAHGFPAANVPGAPNTLQAWPLACGMVAAAGVGREIVGKYFIAMLAGDVLNPARPTLATIPPPALETVVYCAHSARASTAVDTSSAAETIIQFCASESIAIGLVLVPADVTGGTRRGHLAVAVWRGVPACLIAGTHLFEHALHLPMMPYTIA